MRFLVYAGDPLSCLMDGSVSLGIKASLSFHLVTANTVYKRTPPTLDGWMDGWMDG